MGETADKSVKFRTPECDVYWEEQELTRELRSYRIDDHARRLADRERVARALAPVFDLEHRRVILGCLRDRHGPARALRIWKPARGDETDKKMSPRPRDQFSARQRLALLAAEYEYAEDESFLELDSVAEGELWHAVAEAELEAMEGGNNSSSVYIEGENQREGQLSLGRSAMEMSENFEFAQSLGAEEPSDLLPAQAPPEKKEATRPRLVRDFSEGFYSRLKSFLPDFLDVKTGTRRQANVCQIDYSPLNFEERKNFIALLVELEESDKSVRSLVFENNKATLTAGLRQRELL